ncbi:MAG: hypothetical protein M3220_18680 [Chloroflexota bacterium]|nr:hypothetical protein [Chloroflexota bacterium]
MIYRGARARAPGLFLLLLLLVTILLTWPTAVTLTTHVVDRQDPLLNAWIMAWEGRQILVDPLHLYDANIFFPLHNTLAFSEILLSTSALVMPIQWFADDALLSHNVAFLLAFFTSALGAYLLALYLTGHRGAALVAGVAFAWSPYRMGQISQVQLLVSGWLPLALIYLDRLLRGSRQGEEQGRRGAWVKDAFLFGFFFLLQALASFYAVLFSAVACVLYAAGWLLWRRQVPMTAVVGGALAVVLVGVVMLPFVLPYFEVQRRLGAGWTLEMNEQFSASLQAYAYAPEGTRIWGPLTRPMHYIHGACCPPSTLFPGVTVLLLGGLALRRGGSRRWLWLGIGVAGFLLSLGPTLTIRALEPTDITLPYRWLWEYVPGFDAIRAPVRWALLLTLALAMLAAVGIARLRWRWASLVTLLLVVLEFAVAPLPVVPAPEPPASLAWLDEQPPTRILELPLVAERPRPDAPPEQPRRAWESSRLLEAQFFSTTHWHTTPDGYSGYVPTRHGDFAREVHSFPSPRSVAFLQGLGVRYVVVHEDDIDSERAARLEAPLPAAVEEVARFDDERILELAPYHHPGLPKASIPITTLPAQQTIELPVVLTSPNGPYVPITGEPLEVEVTWRQGAPEPVRREKVLVFWPMIVEDISLLRVPLETPIAGEWILTLEGSYPEGQSFLLEEHIQLAEGIAQPPHLLPVTLDRVEQVDEQTVRLLWRSREPLLRYYSMAAQLVAADGSPITQQDGSPGGEVGTLLWHPGVPYGTLWHFDLPEGTTLDDYQLRIHWYDPEGGPPLNLWNGESFVESLAAPRAD